MRTASVRIHNEVAGTLVEHDDGSYSFQYLNSYSGPAISLTMPIQAEAYSFNKFPPFFDGLLPEGGQLEGLLRIAKLDKHDYLGQLLAVGGDLVGCVTVHSIPSP